MMLFSVNTESRIPIFPERHVNFPNHQSRRVSTTIRERDSRLTELSDGPRTQVSYD